jgi:outer membrane protein assembly factor BamB
MRHGFIGRPGPWLIAVALVFWLNADVTLVRAAEKRSEPVLLVVLDPLAKELACACVQGYAQRDYRKLAARLEKALKQRVAIEFSDDLAETVAGVGPTREVVVIGDRSLVVESATRTQLKLRPVCELTDREGATTASGLLVARKDDPARALKDLAGRTVYVGLVKADAKHTAAHTLLSAAKLQPPVTLEDRSSGNEAALDVMDSSASPLPVAVIPSYALPLLEGCGSIRKGDLKVIGRTAEVPFITVFLSERLTVESEQTILQSLLDLKSDAKLLKSMESRDGFRPVSKARPEASRSDGGDWSDWRGARRDGRVSQLPARLPASAKFIWKKAAMTGGLAGLSVSAGRLLLAERDFGDMHDVYRCLNADTGELLWRREFPARGKLDYGQSPRATPVIHEGHAYLLGAFGGLRCVNVADGTVLWERHLPREFKATLPTWGMSATPLVVDDLLIVNPGATNASLAALDLATGNTRWMTPGLPAAYAAFICGEFGGRRQIVGYDQLTLGGWDVKTGERLWRLVPATAGDFNVPTPIAVDGGLVVATENNGTRLYVFDASGRIVPSPAGAFAELAPDTSTPVLAAGRLFGAHQGLHCLDPQRGLKQVWHREDESLGDYATVIADDERVLVITLGGELLLLDARSDDGAIVSRLRVFEEDVEAYCHPAFVGSRLYLRGGFQVVCLDLSGA